MSDVTVRGCAECDLCHHSGYDCADLACTHPDAGPPVGGRMRLLTDAEKDAAMEGEPPPTWCPLRAGPLVVRLEVQRDAT